MKRLASIIAIIIILSYFGTYVSAHYMYYNINVYPYQPYYQSWYYRYYPNRAYLKVNGNYLVDTAYIDHYNMTNAIGNWNYASSRVKLTNVAIDYANVYFCTASTSSWANMCGNDPYKIANTFAICSNRDINGLEVDASNISYANSSIKSSIIFINPYDSTWKKSVIL